MSKQKRQYRLYFDGPMYNFPKSLGDIKNYRLHENKGLFIKNYFASNMDEALEMAANEGYEAGYLGVNFKLEFVSKKQRMAERVAYACSPESEAYWAS
jgi:hypothetical protein